MERRAKPMNPQPQHVVLIPYLNAAKRYAETPLRIGPWLFQPNESYAGSDWASHEFRQAACDLTARYESELVLVGKFDGHRIGATAPGLSEHLEMALWFGLLDAQLRNVPTQWGMQTSDNARIDVWPIDVERKTFTLGFGSYVRILSGGHERDDPSARIPRNVDTPHGMFMARLADADLSSEAFAFLSMETAEAREFRECLRRLSLAWRNDRSITNDDRIVWLRSAFESIGATRSLVEKHTAAVLELNRTALVRAERHEIEAFGVDVFDERNDRLHKDIRDLEKSEARRTRLAAGNFGFTDFLLAGSAVLLDLLRYHLVQAGFNEAKVDDRILHRVVTQMLQDIAKLPAGEQIA